MSTIVHKWKVKGHVVTARTPVAPSCTICHRPMGAIAFNSKAHIRCINKAIMEERLQREQDQRMTERWSDMVEKAKAGVDVRE